MKKSILATSILLGALGLGCGEPTSHAKAVYLLLDTSGTYSKEIKKAQNIANYLLGTLNGGDSLGLARITRKGTPESAGRSNSGSGATCAWADAASTSNVHSSRLDR